MALFLLPPAPSSVFPAADALPRRLPPRSHLQLRCRLTWHPRVALDLLPPPIASRCTSPARATRPSELRRLPPQRRRGGLSAVPWAPILRASQHPWRLLSVETHRRAATGNTKSREVAGALAGTAPSSTARNSVTRPEVLWKTGRAT